MHHDVMIATATRYETLNDPRLLLAYHTIEEAKKNNIPVLLVDDSPGEVKKFLSDNDAILIPQKEKGLGNAIRQALVVAESMLDAQGCIAWQEPEKVGLVRWYKEIIVPLINGSADIVVPARSEASWQTYPKEQRYSEQLGNRYSWILSEKKYFFDLFFGPKIMKKEFVPFFITQHNSWGALAAPVIRAIKNGVRVTSMPIDYEHTLFQRSVEEGELFWCEKRIAQFIHMIAVLKKEWAK